jgi:WD40 repeat protein
MRLAHWRIGGCVWRILQSWLRRGRRQVRSFELPDKAEVLSLDVNPSETILAAGCADATCLLFDMSTGRVVRRMRQSAGRSSTVVCLLSRHLCPGKGVWKLCALVGMFAALVSHDDQVRSVQYSAEGRWLLTSSFDGRAQLQSPIAAQLSLSRLLLALCHGFCMGSLQIALTLGGTLSGPIGVVDIPQSTLAARLAGHSDKVVRACWHPQNLWVVSGGTDRKVILWKP